MHYNPQKEEEPSKQNKIDISRTSSINKEVNQKDNITKEQNGQEEYRDLEIEENEKKGDTQKGVNQKKGIKNEEKQSEDNEKYDSYKENTNAYVLIESLNEKNINFSLKQNDDPKNEKHESVKINLKSNIEQNQIINEPFNHQENKNSLKNNKDYFNLNYSSNDTIQKSKSLDIHNQETEICNNNQSNDKLEILNLKLNKSSHAQNNLNQIETNKENEKENICERKEEKKMENFCENEIQENLIEIFSKNISYGQLYPINLMVNEDNIKDLLEKNWDNYVNFNN